MTVANGFMGGLRLWFDRTFAHWRGDLTGGLTAAVVALPLALAFAVASGVSPKPDSTRQLWRESWRRYLVVPRCRLQGRRERWP